MESKSTSKVIVLGILIALGLGALLYKNFSDYLDAQDKYEQAQQDLDKLKKDIELTKKMLEQYDKEKEEFKQFLFSERDVPAFLDSISQFAVTAQVQLVNMKTKYFSQVKVVTDDARAAAGRLGGGPLNNNTQTVDPQYEIQQVLTLSSMPIDIQVKGDFPALLKFFNQLESYKQLLSVSSIEIKSQQTYPLLSCNFELKIYSLMTLDELKKR